MNDNYAPTQELFFDKLAHRLLKSVQVKGAPDKKVFILGARGADFAEYLKVLNVNATAPQQDLQKVIAQTEEYEVAVLLLGGGAIALEEISGQLGQLCACSKNVLLHAPHEDERAREALVFLAGVLAQQGFYKSFTAGEFAKCAPLYVKKDISVGQVVQEYEQQLARVQATAVSFLGESEHVALYEKLEETSLKLDQSEKIVAELLNRELIVNDQVAHYKTAYEAMLKSFSWRVTKPIRVLRSRGQAKAASAQPAQVSEHLVELLLKDRQSAEEKMPFAKTYLRVRQRALQKLNVVHLNGNSRKIHVVLSAIGGEEDFAAAQTLALASAYAKERQAQLQIVTRASVAKFNEYEQALWFFGTAPIKDTLFYSDEQRGVDGKYENKLAVGEEDIFITCGWQNAYAVRQTFPEKRFFCFAPDDEGLFLPSADERVLYTQVMQDDKICFITYEEPLAQHLKKQGVGNVLCWHGAVSPQSVQKGSAKKQKLVFAARPQDPQAMYESGLALLVCALAQGVLSAHEWEIVFAGDAPSEVDLGGGIFAKGVPALSYGENANVFSGADLVLALHGSCAFGSQVHAAAASGAAVLTNTHGEKTVYSGCKNVIAAETSKEELMQGLEAAIALAQNTELRKKNLQAAFSAHSGEELRETVKNMKGWGE